MGSGGTTRCIHSKSGDKLYRNNTFNLNLNFEMLDDILSGIFI